ncbi:hypothetical protein [Frankia sp. AgKG'84/4]|uniref:hypothetical protein n=1 Tax=Frankia sp. AgKG'84/4 TaxID=573490 RepID=UPI0020104E2D|nr:hypothetical protein [Frankia sp. AgKG'84/4]MCL9795773.1 hypothetical protein [Frankia sp. AgKG'84/4]
MRIPDRLFGKSPREGADGEMRPVRLEPLDVVTPSPEHVRRVAEDFSSVPACITIHHSRAPFPATATAFGFGVWIAVHEKRGVMIIGDRLSITPHTGEADLLPLRIPIGRSIGETVWELIRSTNGQKE